MLSHNEIKLIPLSHDKQKEVAYKIEDLPAIDDENFVYGIITRDIKQLCLISQDNSYRYHKNAVGVYKQRSKKSVEN